MVTAHSKTTTCFSNPANPGKRLLTTFWVSPAFDLLRTTRLPDHSRTLSPHANTLHQAIRCKVLERRYVLTEEEIPVKLRVV